MFRELSGTGADCGGEDLFEALGRGDLFDRFEVLRNTIVSHLFKIRRQLDILVYLDGLDLKLKSGILINHNHRVRVQLQR